MGGRFGGRTYGPEGVKDLEMPFMGSEIGGQLRGGGKGVDGAGEDVYGRGERQRGWGEKLVARAG